MKKYSLFFIGLFAVTHVFSQQQIIYSFAETPQTLLLNPGAETNFSYHYGIPFLNNLSFNAGSTSFNLRDLFQDNGVSFTDKLKDVVAKTDNTDFLNVNLRNDILFGGFRLDRKSYVSFGFYQEFDFIFFMPQDILELGLYGNTPYINRAMSLSHLNFKGTINGVLHAGISKKVNERLNLGARVKIYSASANVESLYNSGTFSTLERQGGGLEQTLNNVNFEARSSGLINQDDQFLNSPSDLFSNTFFGGNFGLGFDFGLTYHFSPQLEFTASLIDIGFIRFDKDIRSYTAEGDFIFEGVNFEFNPDNPRDYWGELEEQFDERVKIDENQNAYTSWRPMRFNASLRYGFGERRPMDCFTDTTKEYFTNAVGFQIHSVFRPISQQFSFTSFFENSFAPDFRIKLTHTVNNYSYAVFGAALAFQWRTLNFVGSIDNITSVTSLETANSMALNLGINFVIK